MTRNTASMIGMGVLFRRQAPDVDGLPDLWVNPSIVV